MKELINVNGLDVRIGDHVEFHEIWDEKGDEDELLESGAVSPDNEHIIDFMIIKYDEDIPIKSIVEILQIS